MRSITRDQLRVLDESDGSECAAAAIMRDGGDLDDYEWDNFPIDEGTHVDDLIARGLVVRYECCACTLVQPCDDGTPVTHTVRTDKGAAAHTLYRTNPELVTP